MRRFGFVSAVITLVAVSGFAVRTVAERWMDCGAGSHSAGSATAGASACGTTTGKGTALAPKGKVLGHFDLAVSGACQFACATHSKYVEKDLAAQPGATHGRLTRCPVSGVVFKVDGARPHVRVGQDEFVTCCGGCAEKLRATPSRFVQV